MLLGVSALIAAVAFAILVGYVTATLIQLRKTLADLHPLLVQLNTELPGLLRDTRQTVANVNAVALEARDGVEHAAVLLHAVGEVGETMQQVHGLVRGRGETLVGRLATLLTGFRAASAVIKNRLSKRDGNGTGNPASPA